MCELPKENASDDEIKDILNHYNTIAVVGVSSKMEKASNMVARYLKANGYTMIPVNPNYDEVLGEKCYPDLKSIPVHVDIVDIFRKPEDVPPIVNDAIKIGADVIWMQQGIVHNESADKARDRGLKVVMNKCIKVEHATL